MDVSNTTITRYLLGELPEGERVALEEQYFSDPRVFDELARAESTLVDDYVRGKLPAETHRRFEEYYLAHPARRERVRFAAALAATLDQDAVASAADLEPAAAARPWWKGWLDAIGGPAPAAAFAVALLVILTGVWLVLPRRGAPEQSAQRPQLPSDSQPTTVPPPPQPPIVPVVTLALVVGPGERSPTASLPLTLSIPADTQDVRLALSLREHQYSRYRVTVRAIGGPEIFNQGDLIANTSSTPATLSLSLPANRFQTGDYMLTLQGRNTTGDFEDLSQSLFRVQRPDP